jgi:hypothetical protein
LEYFESRTDKDHTVSILQYHSYLIERVRD